MKKFLSTSGYYWANVPGRGTMPYARFIVEIQVRRYLRPGEQVHHINRIRTDDRPENLELYANALDHSRQRNRLWP
jgi:hypothetical protein